VPMNLEMREYWRKTKWQGWEWGLWWRSYKALSPPLFASEGFWEIIPAICAAPNSPTRFNGPQPGLSCSHSPCHSFIAAVCCYSPNNRRSLHNLSRLSNRYCTAITPIFSPRFDCSGISASSSGTDCLLGWSFITPLVLTLAPHDHVIYCQAQGLSGHTSSSGECALSHSRATLEG